MIVITALHKLSLEVPKSPTTALRSLSLSPQKTESLSPLEYTVLKTQLQALRANGHIAYTDPAGNELVDDGTVASGDLSPALQASIGAAAAATALNTPSTLVKRDGSGNFAAGVITASLTGVASDVANAAVISKLLTGFVSGAGVVAAADSLLVAAEKLDGNTALKADKPIGVPALGVTANLVGVDGTGSNAAPLVGTEARLDAIEAKVDALIAALNA